MSKVFTTNPKDLIGQEIPVWINPANLDEEPSYRRVYDVRMDEDGQTILVKFFNEDTAAIDPADHYCRIDTEQDFGDLRILVQHLREAMCSISGVHPDARFEYRSVDNRMRYEVSVGFTIRKYHATIRLTSIASELRFKLERFIW